MVHSRSGDERTLRQVRDLVAAGGNDPLAPFALRPDKDFVFSPDGLAAIGYRVRFGTAVASGDPVGEPESWPAAVDAFVREARRRRLRVAVLGSGERAKPMWERHELSAVPIGRDVVLRCAEFDVRGRAFRNLRQAIQRSRNTGVVVEFAREGDLPPTVTLELREVADGIAAGGRSRLRDDPRPDVRRPRTRCRPRDRPRRDREHHRRAPVSVGRQAGSLARPADQVAATRRTGSTNGSLPRPSRGAARTASTGSRSHSRRSRISTRTRDSSAPPAGCSTT